MCSCSDRSGPGGFVLLEAVVALAIIGLVAVALLSTTSTQIRTAGKAGVLLTARSLAEDRLAALRFLNYDDLTDLPDSLEAGRFPPPFDDFEWVAQVAEMEDEYDLFGAEVIVTGRGEAFPLRTLVHAPRPVLAADAVGGVGGSGGVGARGGGRGGDVDVRGGGGSDVRGGSGDPGRGGRGRVGRGGGDPTVRGGQTGPGGTGRVGRAGGTGRGGG